MCVCRYSDEEPGLKFSIQETGKIVFQLQSVLFSTSSMTTLMWWKPLLIVRYSLLAESLLPGRWTCCR